MYYYYVKCSEIEVLNFNKLLSFNFQLAHILQTVTYHKCATIMLRWPISYKQSHITNCITEFNLQLSCLVLTFCLTGKFGITCVFLSVLIYFSLLAEVTKLSMSGFCPRHADEPWYWAKQLTITLVCIFLKSFLVMFLGVKYTLACSSIINNT